MVARCGGGLPAGAAIPEQAATPLRHLSGNQQRISVPDQIRQAIRTALTRRTHDERSARGPHTPIVRPR
jgi:hypothetical protein